MTKRFVTEDSQTVRTILSSMGVASYDASIVSQLLAFKDRHVVNVLGRARKMAAHAGHSDVKPDDVSLAIKSGKASRRALSGLHTSLQEAAQNANKLDIPRISSTFGLCLPVNAPPAVCALAENYIVTVNEPVKKKKGETNPGVVGSSDAVNDSGSGAVEVNLGDGGKKRKASVLDEQADQIV